MSRTYRILLVGIVAVLAVGGYYKLALAPKRAQAKTLSEQVLTAQTQLAQTQSLIATYSGAKKAYQANYATVVRLGKALPADDDSRSLLVQLDAAAKRSGIDFDTIDVASTGASTGTAGAAKQLAPGAVDVGSYAALPLTFSFTGDFMTLGNFLSRVERFVSVRGDQISVNGRMLKIESLDLAAADTGWPGLRVTVGASAYIVPRTDSSATAAGTTATAPTSTSTPSTTASATTSGPSSSGSDLR